MGHADPAVSAQSTFRVCRELQIWKVPLEASFEFCSLYGSYKRKLKMFGTFSASAFSKIFQLTKMVWLKRIMNTSFSNVVIHLCTQRPKVSHSVNILLLVVTDTAARRQ